MRVLAFLFLLGFAWCQDDALSVSVEPAGLTIAPPFPFPIRPITPPGDCICTLEFAPVCGTNGKTFGNSCAASCERVPVKCRGECPCPRDPPSCICTKEYNPVCGADGTTYSNPCLARCKTRVQCQGRCPCNSKPPPPFGCACPRNFDPVCGADGTTYSNPCLARCKTSIKCNRPCPCKPNPPSDCIFSNGAFVGGCSPPPSPTPGSINDLLDDCADKGKTAAVAAARAACSVVKLECPATRPTFQASSLAARGSVAKTSPADAFLDAVLDRACFIEARSACKSNALASVSDSVCKQILNSGPAAPGRKCSSLSDAIRIFEAQVDSACQQKKQDTIPPPFPIG